MTLSADDVDHVAILARIGLSDSEKKQLGDQLAAIVDHVSQLQGIDTSSISPTAQVGGLVNVWREDESRESLAVAAALQNAPVRDGDHFSVGAIQE